MVANTIRTDVSGTIAVTGVAQLLIPRAEFASVEERWVFNLSETDTLWIWLYRGLNKVGQDFAGDPGAIPLAPRTGWSGQISNSIAVQGVAGQGFTAGER